MPRPLNSDDRFTRRAEEFAHLYGGANDDVRARRARFHLAIHLILAEYDLGEDDISEQVLQDGNEQGIDFFWVSPDEVPRVFVVQVKDWRTAPKSKQKDAVNKMADEVEELLARQKVSSQWPSRRKDRFYELKAVRNGDYIVEYVLALTGVAGPELVRNDFAEDRFSDLARLRVMGRDELLQTESELGRALERETTLRIKKSQLLAVTEPKKLVVGLVSVSEYVRATEPLGTPLFELNPRLFLSSRAGPNKAMRETLENADHRKSFHVLNNGITAVCKDLAFLSSAGEDAPMTVQIKGMQVVNGCQTTETLWDWARGNPQAALETLVLVRLVKSDDEEFSALISRTTNTQSAILGTDVVANSEEQKKIKMALEQIRPRPYFYENRRGAIKKLSHSEKERYVVEFGDWGPLVSTQYRIIKMRELAQALQSVTGLPEQAKEGIAGIFKPNNERYNYLFKTSWTSGEQLGLIADLYKFIANTANWGREEWFETEPLAADSLVARYLNLAKLGRFYLLHLVYEYLRNPADPFRESPEFGDELREMELLSRERSAAIREDLRGALGDTLLDAVDALRIVREDPQHGEGGDRALLRQASHKKAIQKAFRNAILHRNLHAPSIRRS